MTDTAEAETFQLSVDTNTRAKIAKLPQRAQRKIAEIYRAHDEHNALEEARWNRRSKLQERLREAQANVAYYERAEADGQLVEGASQTGKNGELVQVRSHAPHILANARKERDAIRAEIAH